jgi:hypothetical protein
VRPPSFRKVGKSIRQSEKQKAREALGLPGFGFA